MTDTLPRDDDNTPIFADVAGNTANAANVDIPQLSLDDKVDFIASSLAALHAKTDNLTQGLMAVHQGLNGLVTMLSAVQQVARFMPGGKKIAEAMMSAQQNMENSNG